MLIHQLTFLGCEQGLVAFQRLWQHCLQPVLAFHAQLNA